MFKRVLIANRGEIACRIIRTLHRMGIEAVAVYSEADRHARHVLLADESICIGPAPVDQSYLRIDAILDAARRTSSQAIHPGYGFLSENAHFAEACDQHGIAFIGPTASQMRDFGLKHTARDIAKATGVPLLPGTDLLETPDEALAAAQRIGYPVILKATAGGGGIGMRICNDPHALHEAFEVVRHLGQANFKSAGVYLERYVADARHIEVQIFGDGHGRVIALGDRDCSTQRRNQKVIEETPAPHLSESARVKLFDAAVRLGQAVSYRSAGTVEFVYDVQRHDFYFLEVNTRLQVEHGVTEMVTGIDLVEWMIRLAAGESLPMTPPADSPGGASIQVRIYAEDPNKNFQPSSGTLTAANFPPDCRVDTWVTRGTEVTPFYDPLLAKIIVHAPDRPQALARLAAALDATHLAGFETNVPYLRHVVRSDLFQQGRVTTRSLASLPYQPRSIDVLSPGNFTTVQDYPGRVGYWAVGVPPSGPMDDLNFRLGNRLLGNDEAAAGLEITITGPTLRFNHDTVICLTGAVMKATLDGAPVPFFTPLRIAAGQTLRITKLQGPGCRSYLLIKGGLDVPLYLGSRATFTLGQFGGHAGRVLRTGDVLHLCPGCDHAPPSMNSLDTSLQPPMTRHWHIGVLDGPHGSPDFFTPADIDMLFATDWAVHYNSARTGVRLVGPKPQWARPDGGEGGLHPSNIHDNAYAIGTIDFTGDMPILLGPDGPSLGGFVCPATVVAAELWKLGQLNTGDKVRFIRIAPEQAAAMEQRIDHLLTTLDASCAPLTPTPITAAPLYILREIPADSQRPRIVYRRSGDKYLLIEYGPLSLDLDLRFRAHVVMETLANLALPGILDLTPGIRSLQVHYDSRILPLDRLLDELQCIELNLGSVEDIAVESRIVHLPISWDDPATQLAIRKYMQSVREDAPWCPSNLEFIRRINGLDAIDDVKRIFFDASWLVLGLGDVYLGAPVATPIDPRHRLVTTKYNPARPWTPENAVGIGGAYLCVYGMEGPGGYQFVGRTVQMWNRYNQTADFAAEKPWLLRFFDQLRFYEVGADELLRLRDEFVQGRFTLKVEPVKFRLRDYHAFLASIRDDAAAFKAKQQAAFDAERADWQRRGEFERVAAALRESEAALPEADAVIVPEGCEMVDAPLAASVWRVLVEKGQRVEDGADLALLEAMKMETAVPSVAAGTVEQVLVKVGQVVRAGQPLFIIRPDAAGSAS
jgi:urea carboxylase